MAARLLLILLLSFSAFAQTSQTTSINGIANQTTSGVGPVACVGTPGNTSAKYLQSCQASTGAVYACNNSAGCTVAADWVAGGTITGFTAGTGLSGGGSSGNVSVALSTPVSIANGGCNATTAAGCANNLQPQMATAWISGGSYVANALASYNGVVYINKTGTNTTNNPSSDSTNWQTSTVPYSGTSLGTVTGPLSSTAIVGQQTVDGVNNTTIAAAITAAGTTGSVMIPATYTCYDSWSSNPNGIPVIDYRSCNNLRYSPKMFGAKGNGYIINHCVVNASSAAISCLFGGTGYSFTANDVGKIIGIHQDSVTYPTSSNDDTFYTTISAVNAGAGTATLAATSPASNSGTTAYLTSDDTAALQNWAAFLNANPGTMGYVSAGSYWYSSATPLSFNNALYVQGEGQQESKIICANPTADCIILNNPLSLSLTGQQLRNLSLYGLGNYTTGNLLVVAGSTNTVLDEVSFYGTAGRAMLLATERIKIKNVTTFNVRQSAVNAGGGFNESSIESFDFQDNGTVRNSLFGGYSWSWNVNSTNGVFPASGSLVADQHTALYFENCGDLTIADGSIKSTQSIGGIRLNQCGETKISQVYIEGYTAGGITPGVIVGGGHEGNGAGLQTAVTLTSGISNSQLTLPITSGLWYLNYVGAQSELATVNSSYYRNFLIRPPDYVYGSTTASSIGGGILQGNAEIVSVQGIVNASGGWTVYLASGGRNQSGGTGAYAWPTGAIVEEDTNNGSGIITLDNIHLDDNGFASPYTLTCNPDNQETCAVAIVGSEPDTYFKWGTPNAITQSYGVMMTGGGSFYAPATSFSQTAFEAHGDANFYSDKYGLATTSEVTATTIYVPSISGTINRPIYASGTGANVVYEDPSQYAQLSGTSSNPAFLGNWLTTYIQPYGGAAPGIGNQFFGVQCWSDDLNASNISNNQFCYVGSKSAPGFYDSVWTNSGTTRQDVFKIVNSVPSATPNASMTLVTAGGTFSISNQTMTLPSTTTNYILGNGGGAIYIGNTSGMFFDSSKNMRCATTGTCNLGTSSSELGTFYSTGGTSCGTSSKSVNYNVQASDCTIQASATITLTLDGTPYTGEIHTLMNTGTGLTVTISGNGKNMFIPSTTTTVTATGSVTSTTITTQYAAITLQYDGTEWVQKQ